MTNPLSDGLFELPAGAGRQAFERDDLSRRTDFQSRAGRAGADFKAMAMKRLTEAGAMANRCDFEVHGFRSTRRCRGATAGASSSSLGVPLMSRTEGRCAERTPSRRLALWPCNLLAARTSRFCSSRRTFRGARRRPATTWRRSPTTSGMWCPTEPIFGAFSGCEHTFKARSMLSRLMHPGGSRTTIMCRHCSTRCGPTARRLAETTEPRADSRPRAPATGGGPDHRAGRRGSGRFPTDNDPAG